MYLRKYRLRKTWLHKSLTSRVSEHPSSDNMGDGSKHCRNLNGSTFTIFINHCEGNNVGKVAFSAIESPKIVC